MTEGEGESDDGHDGGGEEGKAFGRFCLGEDAGPEHVEGEAGDAAEAGGVADPVGLLGVAPGMDGDDDSGKTGEDGEGFGERHAFAQQPGREQSDDDGREEDEDVEKGECEVAERDDDADIVAEVEGGAEELGAELVGFEGSQALTGESGADEGVDEHEEGHEEAEEGEDFKGWQVGLIDELDGGVRKDPEGEAGEGEAGRLEMGKGGFHGASPLGGQPRMRRSKY